MTQHSQNGEGVEVKPCPLCGGRSVVEDMPGTPLWIAICTQCYLRSGTAISEVDAIAAWNTRQSLPREPATADVGREGIALSIRTHCQCAHRNSFDAADEILATQSRAAPSSDGNEQAYESDDRRLFCRHCGRSHIRHYYKAGVGFLCAAPSSGHAMAEGERVEWFVIRRHGSFFRPDAAGYTTHIGSAGFYTREQADKYADVEGVTIGKLTDWQAEALAVINGADRLRTALATTPTTTNDAIPAVSAEACIAAVKRVQREWWCAGDDCSQYDHGRDEGLRLAEDAIRDILPEIPAFDPDLTDCDRPSGGGRQALSTAPSAPATEVGEEVDVNFEVWEDDMMVAGSTSEADARHYHAVYSQDGPVSLQKAVTVRTVLIPATPTDQVKDGKGGVA